MKRFFATLLSLLMSSAVWADSSGGVFSQVSAVFTNSAVTNNTDISLSWLGQIFGTVGNNSLHGSGGQMLGMLFLKFNEGLLGVMAVYLIYIIANHLVTVLTTATLTASGSGGNTFMSFLKVGLGVALMIPLGTGYSGYQTVVMQVVKEGVVLADNTWNRSLDSILAGVEVYHAPSKHQTPATTIGSAGPAVTFVNNVLKDEVQSAGQVLLQKANYDKCVKLNAGSVGDCSNTFTPLYTIDNDKVLFSGGTQAKPLSVSFFIHGTNPADNLAACNGDESCQNQAIIKSQASKAAVLAVVQDELPAAMAYVKYYNNHPSKGALVASNASDNQIISQVSSAFVMAIADYDNLMTPVVSSVSPHTSANYSVQAESEGWASAGRFYYDLTHSSGKGVNDSDATVITTTQPFTNTPNNPSYSYADNTAGLVSSSGSQGPIVAAIKTQLNNYNNTNNAGQGAPPTVGGSGLLYDIIKALITVVVGPIASLAMDAGTPGMDPLVFMHRIGIDCISVVLSVWMGGALSIGIAAFPAGSCDAANPFGLMLHEVVSWMQPFFLAIVAPLMMAGVLLIFYIPLYPYILFSFGIISWIFLVIEAMIAAPLVCLGLTHPQGQDFLGKAEQGVILLLTVFLRPVLMIIGLIAAIIVSYVMLKMVNATFGGIVHDAMGTLDSPGGGANNQVSVISGLMAAGGTMGTQVMAVSLNPLAGLVFFIFCVPMMVVAYTMMVFVVVSESFTLIHVLPDKVGRWIGGAVEQSSAAGAGQQMKGGLSQMGSAAGSGVYQSNDQASAGPGMVKRAWEARKGKRGGGKARVKKRR